MKKLELSFRSGKRVVIGAREQLYVGIDVHKRSYTVAVHSRTRGELARWTMPADPDAVVAVLSTVARRIAWVVYEAGPTGFGLAGTLRTAGFDADPVAPSAVPVVRGRSAKSDTIDASKLARWACKDELTRVYVPSVQEEADRQLSRTRDQVIDTLRIAKQQIRSFLLYYGIEEPNGLDNWSRRAVEGLHQLELILELRFALDTLLNQLEFSQAQLARIDDRLEETLGETRHADDVAIMRSVPGVGRVTATVFKCELLRMDRFEHSGQVAKMTGLVPWTNRTGDDGGEEPIMRTGNARLRSALVEAAWQWIARDAFARHTYDRIRNSVGKSQKAIAAMARKLAVLLWTLLMKREHYRPAA